MAWYQQDLAAIMIEPSQVLTVREVAILLQAFERFVRQELIGKGGLHAITLTPAGRWHIEAESLSKLCKRKAVKRDKQPSSDILDWRARVQHDLRSRVVQVIHRVNPARAHDQPQAVGYVSAYGDGCLN